MNTNKHECLCGMAVGFYSQDYKIDKVAIFNPVNPVILSEKKCPMDFEPRMNTNKHEAPHGIALGFYGQDYRINKIAIFNPVNPVILSEKIRVHSCSFVVQKQYDSHELLRNK